MVQPPLPVAPAPHLPTVLDVPTAGHSGQRSEIRIITEDVISPVIFRASIELTGLGGKASN